MCKTWIDEDTIIGIDRLFGGEAKNEQQEFRRF